MSEKLIVPWRKRSHRSSCGIYDPSGICDCWADRMEDELDELRAVLNADRRAPHGEPSEAGASADVEALAEQIDAMLDRPDCALTLPDIDTLVNAAAALRSRAGVGDLDSLVGLHEGIEINYVVDGYEAALTAHDGATTSRTAHGATIMEALARLSGDDQGGAE